MISVTLPGGVKEQYEYSADGLRRSKTIGQQTTSYLWDEGNLLQEKEDSATTAHYTNQPHSYGALLSQRRIGDTPTIGSQYNTASFNSVVFNGKSSSVSGTSSFYGLDFSGNTRVLTDESGSITDRYIYSAFGSHIFTSGGSTNPYHFAAKVGYYKDSDERLYVRARHYSTSQMRWISADPLGFGGGEWNLYLYSKNNPVSYSDPSGLYSVTCNNLIWLKNTFQTQSGTTRQRTIRQFYRGIATYMAEHGYPIAAANFTHWLRGSGRTRTLPNRVFASELRTQQRMAETLKSLLNAIVIPNCRPGCKAYSQCLCVSVWPTLTDLAGGLGYYCLNGRLRCVVGVNRQVRCTVTWSISDKYNWNEGPRFIPVQPNVPALPGCHMGEPILDAWAKEIEGPGGAREFDIKVRPWTITLPAARTPKCPKARQARGCPRGTNIQGLDPVTMPKDWPPTPNMSIT